MSHSKLGAPKIHLTEDEEAICRLLDGCTTYLRKEKGIITSCRIAGGWVRDKLMGSESNDIDVALSDMMGYPFANDLQEYARLQGVPTGSVGKIEENPDKSKHLQTGTCKVLGYDLDFVNLRSEKYAEGSRVPAEISFGTPLQDALRRDFTINTLFFNVHTREVEDHTGKGLEDLQKHIIRTPLPPRETFLDDPLRILRAVRFSSRFGFSMVAELKAAAIDCSIQQALLAKVSRERVGIEVSKMLQGKNPLFAIQLIRELKLYLPIFYGVPDMRIATFEPSRNQQNEALAAATILHALTERSKLGVKSFHSLLFTGIESDPGSLGRLYLASLLIPYLNLTYKDKKNKSILVVDAIIREVLKLGCNNHYLDGIPILFSSLPLVRQCLSDHSQSPLDRVRLGLLLRNKFVHNPHTGSHWSSSILFALVVDSLDCYDIESNTTNVEALTIKAEPYTALLNSINDFELSGDVETKPLLSGKEVLSSLGVSKAGPWLGEAMDDVVSWQLGHPKGTKEECMEWIQPRWAKRLSQEEDSNSRKRTRVK